MAPTSKSRKSMPAASTKQRSTPARAMSGNGGAMAGGAAWPLNGTQTRSLNANLDKLADLTISIKKQLGPVLQGQNLTAAKASKTPAQAKAQGGANAPTM